MRRRAQPLVRRLLGSPMLTGTVIIVVIAVAVYVSYTAQNGLPLLPTYRVTVDIPDAAQLTKNADVRVGGARVGQVLKIAAMPATRRLPPYARLQLALSPSAGPLPRDTTVQLRLSSVLGGKYIELHPGHSKRTVPDGGSLPLANAKPIVGLDEAFRAFDVAGRRQLSLVITSLGDSLAGRGDDINHLVGSTRTLLDPLERVLRVLADPSTDLAGLVRGAASATGALAPVASTLTAMLADGSRTLAAIDAAGPALGQSLDALPPTELQGTGTLRRIRPVLADAAAIARSLRPAASMLPAAAHGLLSMAHAAEPVLRRVPQLTGPLQDTFAAVEAFAGEPAAIGAFRTLGDNDLASFGASAFVGLGALLRYAAPAQLHCNAVALWARNLSSAMSEGDSGGTWIRMLLLNDPSQTFQSATPASDLHVNQYPNEDASECEAGNEPYLPGQRIGNPPGNQSTRVDITHRQPGLGG